MKIILFISFLFYYTGCFAQNEYERWVVCSYNMDFCDSLSLSSDTSFSGNEGYTTICDKNTGKLLFYTDAQRVYNSNFQIMPNGNDLNGAPEPVQASLIVPQSGSSTIYYLFTIDRFDLNGLNYSIVDMSKDGGLGDVTVKNVFLDSSTERLNAVYNDSGNFFWIIANDPITTNFISYKLDSNGLNTTPVLSPLHVLIDTIYRNSGYLKSSPDGEHVVCTFEGQPPVAALYSFDKSSGILNLETFLPVGNGDEATFGASFSPNNSKIYITETEVGASEIYQFDITSSDTNVIKASRITVASLNSFDRFGGMQMGPDEKLYITRESFDSLSVIDKPNLGGDSCQFKFDTITTPIENYIDAFNNNIDGLYYFATAPNISLAGSVACNKMASFTITAKRTYNYFTVYFGDGQSVNLDSTAMIFTHQYDSAGTYTVKLYTAIGCVYDSTTTAVTVTSEQCSQSLIIPTIIYSAGSQTKWHIINLPQGNNSVTLYDELGRVFYNSLNYQNDYDMRMLSSAMYFYRLTLENGEVYAGKVVVVR